jgi:hypothetical protein
MVSSTGAIKAQPLTQSFFAYLEHLHAPDLLKFVGFNDSDCHAVFTGQPGVNNCASMIMVPVMWVL